MAESVNSSTTENTTNSTSSTNTTNSTSSTKSTGSAGGAWDFSKSSNPLANKTKEMADSTIKSEKSLLPNNIPSGSNNNNNSSSSSSSSSNKSSSNSSSNNMLKILSDARNNIKVEDVWSTGKPSSSSTDEPKIDRTSDKGSGDYQAYSNEKSEVKTNTLGKQSDIVTSPTLTSENKGLVDNTVIDSVEGLITEQKDKASQEVLDASKKRNEAEEEDKTDQIKNQLTSNEDDEIDTAYKNLDSKKSKEVATKQQTLNQKQKELDNRQKTLNQRQQELDKIGKERDLMQFEVDSFANSIQDQENKVNAFVPEVDALVEEAKNANASKNIFNLWSTGGKTEAALDNIEKLFEDRGMGLKIERGIFVNDALNSIEENKQKVVDFRNKQIEDSKKTLAEEQSKLDEINALYDKTSEEVGVLQKNVDAAQRDFDVAQKDFDNVSKGYNTWKGKDLSGSLRNQLNNVKTAYENGEISPEQAVEALEQLGLMDDYNPFGFNTSDMVYLAGGLDGSYLSNNPSRLGEYTPPTTMETTETPTTMEEIVTESMTEPTTGHSLTDAANNLRQQYQGEEWAEDAASRLEGLNSSQEILREAVKPIAEKGLENCTPDEIAKYIEAQENYNNNLKSALNNGKAYQQHDFNKDFVRSVAQANDFKVTLPDGSTMSYSDFATDMVVESPKIASAMYENKANNYEDNGRKVLATIERAKAKMVQTWAGSKLALADNKVRDQFNQMADTNMRATYAAYNNVLKDPKASDAMKEEASTQISQAKSLKTASTALKASTGFFSGIGDSHSDGVYGTVDPGALNTYQKTLNGINSFAQIALGLGVSPAANKAYQNLYYLNPDYLNNDSILAKDFDKDGFAWVEEYGNNAAAGMILAGAELATGVALMFSPATAANGMNLIIDSIDTFMDSLYGVRGNAVKASKMTNEVLSYFKDAENLNGLPSEATNTINNAIVQIENFELKADEVANLDNWLEGSGSNTADNGKFNQSLSYDEWLKLIESDETLRNYAKSLVDKKKEETV